MIKAAHLIVCACVMSELYVLVDVSICSGRGIGDNWQVGVKGSAQAQLSYFIVWLYCSLWCYSAVTVFFSKDSVKFSAKCRDERPSVEVHTKQNQLFELTKCGSPTCLISQSKIGSLHDEEFEMESIFSILVVLHRPTHFDRERF